MDLATLQITVSSPSVTAATDALTAMSVAATKATTAVAGLSAADSRALNDIALMAERTNVMSVSAANANAAFIGVNATQERVGIGARRSALQMDALAKSMGSVALGGDAAATGITGVSRALSYLTLSNPALFEIVTTLGLIWAGWEAVKTSIGDNGDAVDALAAKYKDLNRVRLEALLDANNRMPATPGETDVGFWNGSDGVKSDADRIKDNAALATAIGHVDQATGAAARTEHARAAQQAADRAAAAAQQAAAAAARRAEAQNVAVERAQFLLFISQEEAAKKEQAKEFKDAADAMIAAQDAYDQRGLDALKAQDEAVKELVKLQDAAAQEAAKSIHSIMQSAQHDLTSFFDSVLVKGLKSFSDLFTQIKDLFFKLVADMAAKDIIGSLKPTIAGLLGTGGSAQGGSSVGIGSGGSLLGGALSAALPTIAAVGLGIGLLTSLFASDAQAAQAAAQAQVAFTADLKTFTDTVNGTLSTSLAQAIAQVHADADKLRAENVASYGDSFTPAQAAEANAALANINALEATRISQLQQEAQLLQSQNEQDYQVRLLRAQGLTDQADALALNLKEIREYNAAVAAGDDVTVLAALKATQAAEIHAQAAAVMQKTIDSLTNTVGTLRQFRDALTLNTQLSAYSPIQQLAAARQAYQQILTQAQTGDQAAAGQLPAAAQAFLTASRAVNASSVAYVQDFQKVQSDTAAVLAMFEAQKSLAQQQLDDLNNGFTQVGNGIITLNTTTATGLQQVSDRLDAQTDTLVAAISTLARKVEGLTLS